MVHAGNDHLPREELIEEAERELQLLLPAIVC